ncbi:hypothetical protein LEP1GSC058_4145 [Leptospira fainei serovar Hurstbridge str. BUT 6]|uniref:Uncharacterized protein n=1 Tax=Leptospira fainei serovar Hurstbridge str. BUT 6 TaxID=1193011 RepID=S3V977_9LEPT|nr:hypothetical protein [Leptospira fainei]EPG72960.1 hypothetical protein LEP1GSC058_4145 [Leptospira fainei serovar Hurstbridge str. BUT 6]
MANLRNTYAVYKNHEMLKFHILELTAITNGSIRRDVTFYEPLCSVILKEDILKLKFNPLTSETIHKLVRENPDIYCDECKKYLSPNYFTTDFEIV